MTDEIGTHYFEHCMNCNNNIKDCHCREKDRKWVKKVCIICKGIYPLPQGYVKGMAPNRCEHWMPEEIREQFICAECCHSLLKTLVNHALNDMYGSYSWIACPKCKKPRAYSCTHCDCDQLVKESNIVGNDKPNKEVDSPSG